MYVGIYMPATMLVIDWAPSLVYTCCCMICNYILKIALIYLDSWQVTFTSIVDKRHLKV